MVAMDSGRPIGNNGCDEPKVEESCNDAEEDIVALEVDVEIVDPVKKRKKRTLPIAQPQCCANKETVTALRLITCYRCVYM